MSYRILDFNRVVEKLRCGHYNKLCNADYSNLGVELFDEKRFAGNLGVSVDFLYRIGLLRKGDNAGWNICLVPNYKSLIDQEEVIKNET